MQKLMIADGSDAFAAALAEALQPQFQVRVCTDGKSAMELLPIYQPDILILNLMLPYVDGLTVLQESGFQPSVILVITMHMSSYVERTVTALGVDYTMICPSVNALVQRLQDLLQQYTPPQPHRDLHSSTIHHLQLLGIPAHLAGYRQLCLALPLFAENPQLLLTKELYPEVARLSGCADGRSVEHSIRKAIHAAWQHRDNAIWRKYFPFGPQGSIPCPSNKEFLCRLAQLLRTGDEIV